MPLSKIALFLALSSTIFMSGCKVTKQISKQDTQTESASKVDSASQVNKDVTKESKIETVTTEVIDTMVQINTKGEIVIDTTGQKTTSVKVRKTKTTKTHAEIKEIDKTHAKVEVKKSEKKEEAKTAIAKDVKKSGILWYWWLIIAISVLAALAWRFLRK